MTTPPRRTPPRRTAERFDLTTPVAPAAVLRLLESGDTGDLRWLFAELGEEGVRGQVVLFGNRLNRRSRVFWHNLFGLKETETRPLVADIWPLA